MNDISYLALIIKIHKNQSIHFNDNCTNKEKGDGGNIILDL